MFTRYKGKVKTVWLPATATTAFSKGAIVSWSSGYLVPATSSTTALSHAGVIERAVASTDADYATTGHLVPVSVPVEKNVAKLAFEVFCRTAAPPHVKPQLSV